MEETLDKLIYMIDKEIHQCNDQIKVCKKDTKRLLKSKDGLIEAGIDDFIFDDNIQRIMNLKDNLEERLYKLKKIKYRLDVAKRMLNELN